MRTSVSAVDRIRPWLISMISMLTLVVSQVGDELSAQANAPPEAEAPVEDRWGPLRLLEGTWRGAIAGRLGQGEGVRVYEFVFGGRYLVSRHTSVRMPQEASPEGDRHRELGVYSYDREAGTLVLREFMEEGFVIRSTCATVAHRIVCEAQDVESGPGMRARLTLEVPDAFHFREIYELAWPGQDELAHYFTNEWERVPDLDNRR